MVEAEPNDSFATATEAFLSSYIANAGIVGVFQQPGILTEDFWVVRDATAGLLQITVDASSTRYEGRVFGFEVLTEAGTVIANHETTPDPYHLVRRAVEVESGSYFLRFYGDYENRYEFGVSVLPAAANEEEPNVEVANHFSLEEVRYGRFERPLPWVEPDFDYFFILVEEAGQYGLEVTAFGESSGYVFADFFSDTGNLLVGGPVWEGNQTRWNFFVPTPGIYFLGLYGTSRNHYTFRVLPYRSNSLSFEIEQNGDLDSANSKRTHRPTRGQISRSTFSDYPDMDYFYFKALTAGEVYLSYDIDGERWTGRSLQFTLVDSQWNQLSTITVEQGEGESDRIDITEPGVYYIRVQGTSYEQYSVEVSGWNLADVPGRPTVTEVVEEDGSLLVDGMPGDDGGSEILGFVATCFPESSWPGLLPLRVSGLANGKSYSCSLAAYNEFGLGPNSFGTSATPRGVPSDLRILSVIPEPGGLRFNLYANLAGGNFPEYKVTCGSKSATNDRPIVIVSDLEPDEAVSCYATATNQFGESEATESVTATPLLAMDNLPLWLLWEAIKKP